MYDGDLVLVLDNETMMKGVDRNATITIDIDDKVCALVEADTPQNRTACIIRSMKSRIGEISNFASAYHNKAITNEEQRKRYDTYINLLSVSNGKEIDAAKTGVHFKIPRNIEKYGRPLPYFMKYASPYYKRMKKLSCAHSNMNMLCFELERWENTIRKRRMKKFDWRIMFDEEIGYNQEHFDAIELIFCEFYKLCRDLAELNHQCRHYETYKDILREQNITKEIATNFEVNWQYYYNIYRSRCQQIVPDVRELANICVVLCYDKYKSRNKKFMWQMAGKGVVENIKQVNICLPQECDDGEYEYLGKRYTLAPVESDIPVEYIDAELVPGGDCDVL